MVKKKTISDKLPEIPPIPVPESIPANEYPSPLIHKLSEFYNKNPDYKTGIVDIAVMARIVNQELNNFISRPHKQVTEVYFDRDVPSARFVCFFLDCHGGPAPPPRNANTTVIANEVKQTSQIKKRRGLPRRYIINA